MNPNREDDPVNRGQPEEHTDSEETARRSRQTGGDAPAAASAEEREAVAEDRDELFGPPSERRDGKGQPLGKDPA
jgi:hypothetical protein